MKRALITLKDGKTLFGYCNSKQYNGYYYINQEGYKFAKKYRVEEVLSIEIIEYIRR